MKSIFWYLKRDVKETPDPEHLSQKEFDDDELAVAFDFTNSLPHQGKGKVGEGIAHLIADKLFCNSLWIEEPPAIVPSSG